jgi:hypothetical protein
MKIRSSVTWLVDWDGRSWWLDPGTEITVVARCPDIGCAAIQFPNPSPIEEPRIINAVVPLKDLDFNVE